MTTVGDLADKVKASYGGLSDPASAPNPLAPTARESIAAALTPEEQERFVTGLRAAVEAGDRLRRSAVAYLVASNRADPIDGTPSDGHRSPVSARA